MDKEIYLVQIIDFDGNLMGYRVTKTINTTRVKIGDSLLESTIHELLNSERVDIIIDGIETPKSEPQ